MLLTERLRLLPLSLEQLQLLAADRNELESSLGLVKSNFKVGPDPSFLKSFEEIIVSYTTPDVERNPEYFEWYTHWLIVDQQLNLTIGGIGVNGLPDENGQTMLGYFIDKKFENQGIATEAVQMLTQYLFKNKDLKSIIADTFLSSINSQKVLQKSGFTFREENEDGLRWELIPAKFT